MKDFARFLTAQECDIVCGSAIFFRIILGGMLQYMQIYLRRLRYDY